MTDYYYASAVNLPVLKHLFGKILLLFPVILLAFLLLRLNSNKPQSSGDSTLDSPSSTVLASSKKKKASPTPTAIISTSHIKFGVVVNDYANRTGELSYVEQILGKPLSTVSIYKQFGGGNTNLIPDDLSYIKSKNYKLQLAWEPWNPAKGMSQSEDYLTEIPTGKLDSYLHNFALSVKSYGYPVTLRFAHEMNGNWYPWGNRPVDYIKAYRYIVTYFRQEGINNVTWMWSINADNVPASDIFNVSIYYPGDDVVDVIGIDGFNFGTPNWRSSKDIFNSSYTYLSRYNKPIIISEVASSEIGGDKSAWVKEFFIDTLLNMPNIKEVVWFDLIKETDWRIDSSKSSLQAFQNYL